MIGKRAVFTIVIIIAIVVFFIPIHQTGGHTAPSIVVLDSRNNDNGAITQLLSNQQQLLKLALAKKPEPVKVKVKVKEPVKEPVKVKVKVKEPKFKDWAALGTATQSSTYQAMEAINAID